MPLPTSREYTATSATAISSSAFNVVQDCIIGSKHPDVPLSLNAISGSAGSGWTIGVLTGLPGARCDTTGSTLGVWLPLIEGTRITSLSFRAKGNGTTASLVCNVKTMTSADVVTTIGTRTLAAGFSASFTTYQVTGLTPTLIPAGGGAWVEFDPQSVAGQTITAITVGRDRL